MLAAFSANANYATRELVWAPGQPDLAFRPAPTGFRARWITRKHDRETFVSPQAGCRVQGAQPPPGVQGESPCFQKPRRMGQVGQRRPPQLDPRLKEGAGHNKLMSPATRLLECLLILFKDALLGASESMRNGELALISSRPVGRLQNKVTDHQKGIAPVSFWVRRELRRPGRHCRRPSGL